VYLYIGHGSRFAEDIIFEIRLDGKRYKSSENGSRARKDFEMFITLSAITIYGVYTI